MKEIEVKLLEIKKDKVIKRLEELGAEKVSDGEMNVLIYDFEDERLSRNSDLVRLRGYNGDSVLAFKRKISKGSTKIMEEYEVKVDNYNVMKDILKNMGLRIIRDYSKHRTSYKLGKVHFDIDTIPGIPTFMEIEALDEETVKKYVVKLGFSLEDAKPWTGKDLLKHYKKI